jgi:hypothetical protein
MSAAARAALIESGLPPLPGGSADSPAHRLRGLGPGTPRTTLDPHQILAEVLELASRLESGEDRERIALEMRWLVSEYYGRGKRRI